MGSHVRRVGGFTLVELLVVIAIIGILVGLLLPAVQVARESARRSQCANNIKQLALACLNYSSVKKGFPPAVLADGKCSDPRMYHTGIGPNWAILVLPYMEQSSLYDGSAQGIQTYLDNAATGAIAGDATWVTINGANNSIVSQPVDTFLCPSDIGNIKLWTQISSPGGTGIQWARGNYGANAGSGYFAATTTLPGGMYGFLRTGSGVAGDPYVYTEITDCSSGNHSGLGLPGNNFKSGWVMGVNTRIREKDVTDGLSKTVLINELRIAVNDSNSTQKDPRGTWALGVIGASIVGASGRNDSPGPNISLSGYDDIQGCFNDPANGMGCSGSVGQVTAKSRHSRGVQAAFCDGSVQWVGDEISQLNYYRIHSRNDGLSGPTYDQ